MPHKKRVVDEYLFEKITLGEVYVVRKQTSGAQLADSGVDQSDKPSHSSQAQLLLCKKTRWHCWAGILTDVLVKPACENVQCSQMEISVSWPRKVKVP